MYNSVYVFEKCDEWRTLEGCFILGGRGLPTQFGGFETFVESWFLIRYHLYTIRYHVNCLSVKVLCLSFSKVQLFTVQIHKLIYAVIAAYTNVMANSNYSLETY